MVHELNLLPPHRRSLLRRDVLLRAATRFFNSVLLGLLVVTSGGVALAVVLWATALRTKATDAELALVVQQFSESRTVVGRHNAFLTTLDTLDAQRLSWAPLLRDVLAIVPPSTTLSTITADAASGEIILTGVAPARSTLIVFEERLKLLPWTVSVASPSENLLLRDNPSFRFSLTLDPALLK